MATRHPDAREGFLLVTVAALTVGVCLRSGSYDVIPRQEYSLLVLLVLGLGWAVGILPRASPPRFSLVPVAALLALAGWIALSLGWTESSERTAAELARVLGYAGLVGLVVSVASPRTWLPIAGGLAAGAAAVCVLSFTSRLAPGALTSVISQSGFQVKRLSWPFDYWNAVGVWGAMTVGLLLPWSAHARRALTRALALASMPFAVAIIYLSYSRSGLYGAALAVIFAIALSRHRWLCATHAVAVAAASAIVIAVIRSHEAIALGTGTHGAVPVLIAALAAAALCAFVAVVTARLDLDRRWRLPPARARQAVIGTAVLVVLAGAAFGPRIASRAWDSFNRPVPRGTADPAQRFGNLSGDRKTLWTAGLNEFRREPLKGAGAGTWEFVWDRAPEHNHYVRNAHNLYVEALAEMGLPGALLLVIALGSLAAGGVSARRRLTDPAGAGAVAAAVAALGTFIVTAGFDWMWQSTAVAALALASGAIGVAAAPSPRRMVPGALRAAVAALALLAMLVQIPHLISTSELRHSQELAQQGSRPDLALAHANDAVAAEPWAGSPFLQRALVLETSGALRSALADATAATDREPTNWRPWLLRARLEAELGRANAALRAYRKARSLNPRSKIFQRTRSQ